ncbi:MAG: hypothetical protein LBF51_07645 [Zoogloeaceae bacterium]|jgi:hypothetical protein|nr:hypothetical protein [Zoogloeaceae bacterium]
MMQVQKKSDSGVPMIDQRKGFAIGGQRAGRAIALSIRVFEERQVFSQRFAPPSPAKRARVKPGIHAIVLCWIVLVCLFRAGEI